MRIEPGVKIFEEPKGLNPDKLDDAVLAMLSLCITDEEIGNKAGIQADPGFDWNSLERLHKQGFLATPPNILADRPIWLTPEGVRRARELFRKTFCD